MLPHLYVNRRFSVTWGFPADLRSFDYVVTSAFTSSLAGQWLMRYGLRGVRWVYWGECFHPHRGWKARIQRALAEPISRACSVVGIGSVAQRDFLSRFPETSHFNIPYHCELSEFFQISRPRPGNCTMRFLFCGQMIYRKGVDLLLQAFDRMVGKQFDAELLLVGREAELPAFLERVSPATRRRIRYEGFQPPDRLTAYFEQSDAFILPSRYDGWGVVISQALAAGLPVISTDKTGAAIDLIEPGVNGIIVCAGKIDPLQDAMEELVRNRILATEMARNARQSACDLTPEAGARKWVRVFETLDNLHR
jgi:glycosyltransferase involved in cell wall biosynthesis